MSSSESNSTDRSSASTAPPTKAKGVGESVKSRRRGGLLVKCVIGIGLLVVGLIIAQQWMVPEVDAEKTRPIVITGTAPDADPAHSVESPSESVEPAVNLPEGAVTASLTQQMFDEAEHPFDPLLDLAQVSLEKIDETIQDYTSTMVSQVRVDGKLHEEKYLLVKIRHARKENKKKIPFSVYTLFLKPQANVGQEAIWVEGKHDDNLVAHANGLLNVKRFYLPPEGAIAMEGNRYSIRLIGMRNLIVKMADMAVDEREHGECTVTMKRNVEINGRKCTLFEAVHPEPRDHFEFHIARIYIDDNHNIPVAYEGFLWPEKEGEEPPLLERYVYTDIEFNVGLTDKDFDPSNEEYQYPKW